MINCYHRHKLSYTARAHVAVDLSGEVMFIKYAILPTFCLFTVAPLLAAGHSPARAPVPPASFLNYHVSTVHELSQEVTLDPTVRARLANHFHVSEAQITQYVRQNLVLTHLQKGGNYRVACVGRDGREFWIESHLPAGTAIFASRATGRPILKLACGNPMVSSLPPVLQTADNNANIGPAQFASLPPPALTDAAPMPGLLIANVTPTELVVATADVAPPIVLVSDFPPLGPILSGGSRSFNVLPALLGGLAVGIASTGHGGSTPSITPPPAPIPEASTSTSLGVMLLLGGGALLVLRRKRMSAKTM